MMSNVKKHRTVLIEPSQIVQQGIKALLEFSPEFEVTGCFTDYHTFVESPKNTTPDIIIINPLLVSFHKQFDVRSSFPEYPDTLLIAILYNYIDPETIKSFDGSVDIYDDHVQIAKKLNKMLNIKQHHDQQRQEDAGLSDREKEILVSVAQGLTNKEIAEKHFISIHTVISHRKNITRKTGIKTVSGLTIYALVNKLLSQEELK